jgi:hypothetical protein
MISLHLKVGPMFLSKQLPIRNSMNVSSAYADTPLIPMFGLKLRSSTLKVAMSASGYLAYTLPLRSAIDASLTMCIAPSNVKHLALSPSRLRIAPFFEISFSLSSGECSNKTYLPIAVENQ